MTKVPSIFADAPPAQPKPVEKAPVVSDIPMQKVPSIFVDAPPSPPKQAAPTEAQPSTP